ncbi:hypothetical protein M3C59_007745 [Micrococcus luteus]|uniref:hypothetical protein n=1 Tax=Micrococcus TaxID=1269 RepID=UPI0007AB5D43|nr:MULTISPECIES: hypothetical protein [Micrococcus]KZE70398.1 hypothetical protein AWM60_05880 [Micrococcus aloeverae]MCV7455897.1 hypothetical protein [Micrococcus luteus]MCV7472007.1 hypothetical protein [Micrococcus luteus]MCV7487657.1 hypothetical protein [Micrococcus luteus]MCV7555989.1 hypothetical protein [Micrococcus luteus]
MSTTMPDRPTTAPALADGATTKPTLTTTQALAVGFTLTGARPDWDTSETRAALAHLGNTWHFPHAVDFPHIIRAAVHYATATTGNGDLAHRSIASFPYAGPWWSETVTG